MTFNHFLSFVVKAFATDLQYYVSSVVSSIVTFFDTSSISSRIEHLMAEVPHFSSCSLFEINLDLVRMRL
jgi:hypothetical protein